VRPTSRRAGLAALALLPAVLGAAGEAAEAPPPGIPGVVGRAAVVRPAEAPEGRVVPPTRRARPVRRRVPGQLAAPARGGGQVADLAPAAAPALPVPLIAAPARSFAGLRRAEAGGFVPPDTQVAAGPGHVVQAVNTAVRVFTRAGEPLLTRTLEGFLGLPSAAFVFDPKVRFDVLSGRWLLAAVSDDGTSGRWHLAVSATGDPLGEFFVYRVTTPLSLPDFPALGIADDKVVLAANAFSCVPTCEAASEYLGSEFVVFDKAALLAGQDADVELFPPDQGLFSLQPAHALSPTTAVFMTGVDFGSASDLRLWEVTGVPGVGPGVQVATTDLPIRPLGVPPGAAQAGSPILLNSGDNRLLDTVFRDGRLWTAASARCLPPGDVVARSCLRLVEIATAGPEVTQDLDVGTAGTHAYYPAVQTDQAGNLVVVYSRSSPAEFASVYVTGRFAGDPPDTIRPPVLVKAGEAAYTPSSQGFNRWGDYSGASVDPADPSAVWVAGEYARAEGGVEWGTWIAQVRLAPFAGGVFVAAGDLDGAGLAEIVTGAGPGAEPRVRTFTASGTGPLLDLLAYPAGTAGVRVAACDLTGDGRAEIVAGPGPGFPPRLRGFDGGTGAFLGELAVGPDGYLGGVFVACADVTGDGVAEVIASADAGVLPLAAVWQVAPGPAALLAEGVVLDPGFTGGVRVAACDLTGDGRAEVLAAAGPGGAPRVRVFDGGSGAVLSDFLALEAADPGGVFVACGEVLAGAGPVIVTGRAGGAPPEVRVFGLDGTLLAGPFAAGDPGFEGGVRVGVGPLSGGGPEEIVTAPGPGGGAVRVLTGAGGPTAVEFAPY
jgi:hypothetical protein